MMKKILKKTYIIYIFFIAIALVGYQNCSNLKSQKVKQSSSNAKNHQEQTNPLNPPSAPFSDPDPDPTPNPDPEPNPDPDPDPTPNPDPEPNPDPDPEPPTIPESFTLSVSNRNCSFWTTSWKNSTAECKEGKPSKDGTPTCSKISQEYLWVEDLEYGGQAKCRTKEVVNFLRQDNTETFNGHIVATQIHIICPTGYRYTSQDQCRHIKALYGDRPVSVSISDCTATCTKIPPDGIPEPPNNFTVSVSGNCSFTSQWIGDIERWKSCLLYDEPNNYCWEKIYSYTWLKHLDHGVLSVCQQNYYPGNQRNADNNSVTHRSHTVSSTIFAFCPDGYSKSSGGICASETKTASAVPPEAPKTLSVVSPSPCEVTCTKE